MCIILNINKLSFLAIPFRNQDNQVEHYLTFLSSSDAVVIYYILYLLFIDILFITHCFLNINENDVIQYLGIVLESV